MSTIFTAMLLLLALTAIVLGWAGIFYGTHHLILHRARANWLLEYDRIVFGPAAATTINLRSHWFNSSVGSALGVLGIANDHLIYRNQFGNQNNFAVPLEDVHGVGLQLFAIYNNAKKIVYRVRVDFQSPGGWQVYTFEMKQWRKFADALTAATKLTLYSVQELKPVTATRMNQDIYGQWHPDFTDKLYLAPDRLLFAWENAIMLANIRSLTLYVENSSLDLLAHNWLRIEYLPESGAATEWPRVVGFRLPNARQWGECIAARTNISPTVHSGRKKKPVP